jgi:hypothetical protein
MQALTIETQKGRKAASRDKNYWRELVTTWQKNNEHPKDFCARIDIKLGTFLYWRGIFKKKYKQGNKFIELEITPKARNLEQIVIKCPSDHKIILPSALKIEQTQVLFKLLGVT